MTVDLLIALAHLQEIRETDDFCCIELSSDYAFVWDITFVHESWRNDGGGHRMRKVCGHSHYTLEEAIEHFYAWWQAGADDADTILMPKRIYVKAFEDEYA